MQRIEQHTSFDGRQEVWQHTSTSTGTSMNVGVYLPPKALAGEPCPVLYWLSGLTCTEQNFIVKAGAQRYAAEHGVILVAPDSFKGTFTASEVAEAIGRGVRSGGGDPELMPAADGGAARRGLRSGVAGAFQSSSGRLCAAPRAARTGCGRRACLAAS